MPEYLLQEGDIVFGRKGAVERSARVAVEQAGWFLGSDGIRLRLPSFCDSRFVSYLLLSKQHQKWMIQHSAGTTMASLNEKIVRRVPLILPPINIQKKIAEVLGTLDNKIDLNRQMNTTLETMAQALFKSWFVDFDPVIDNALAAGNTIPEPFHARAEARKALGDQRKPLPAAIQHQFPDRFVLTEEMGWVPEGWEIVPLMEFGRIVCGKTPSKSKSEYFGKDTPFIKIPDMHTSMFVVDPIEKLSELGASSQAKKSVPRGSVCVSCIATVGKVVIASTESQTNQQINSVVPRAEYLTPYLYFYMLSLERLFHDLASGGSATLNMNTSTFSRVRVLKPCKVLLRFFGDSVQSQFSKIEINQKESMTLTKLRDTLLPKLLSGELRIPEDEQ
jgi:type I restriction enzyme S subunit